MGCQKAACRSRFTDKKDQNHTVLDTTQERGKFTNIIDTAKSIAALLHENVDG